MSDLSQKKCKSCEGIGKALSLQEAQQYLKNTPGWELKDKGELITRHFVLKNFMSAIKFVNQIAEIAEQENHHPDLHLTGYRRLRIDLTTHALCGLTENDFILAAKINELPAELKE